MRCLLVVVSVAACTNSVSDGDVVEYLLAKPPEVRAQLVAKVEQRPEQPGLITREGKPLTIVGAPLEVGTMAPAVQLVDPKMETIDLGALRGKLVVLSVVPSIDTRVCETQTHRVSDAIGALPPNTAVITVSRDLPFAQGRFAEDALTQTLMGSDYRGGGFGRAFGIEVKETGLLVRSVWVIGRDGKVAYRELVADQSTEPDYAALIEAAKRAAGA